MRKPKAVAGSVVFFLVAPGVVAGLVPWLITRWHPGALPAGWSWLALPLRLLGVALVVAGAGFVVTAFARFVTEGFGTPAPVAPPTQLVVGGVYRFVRNPMYVAVLACVVGQSLALLRPVLLLYAVPVAAAMVAFVHWYEEPNLARRFGADFATYKRAVPGWWPRLRPWRPGSQDAGSDRRSYRR